MDDPFFNYFESVFHWKNPAGFGPQLRISYFLQNWIEKRNEQSYHKSTFQFWKDFETKNTRNVIA